MKREINSIMEKKKKTEKAVNCKVSNMHLCPLINRSGHIDDALSVCVQNTITLAITFEWCVIELSYFTYAFLSPSPWSSVNTQLDFSHSLAATSFVKLYLYFCR